MSDLIDRQAAIDEAEEWIDAVYFEENDKCARIAIQHVINGLKELPPAQPMCEEVSPEEISEAININPASLWPACKLLTYLQKEGYVICRKI